MTPRDRLGARAVVQGPPPAPEDPAARAPRRLPATALERRRDHLLNVIDHWTLVHDDAVRRLREARDELRLVLDAMNEVEP